MKLELTEGGPAVRVEEGDEAAWDFISPHVECAREAGELLIKLSRDPRVPFEVQVEIGKFLVSITARTDAAKAQALVHLRNASSGEKN